MFCPKCGTPNIEDAKYCRSCGTDISLVPQALTRSLPALPQTEADEGKEKKKDKPPTLERGLGNIFEGFGYLAIVLIGFFYFWGAIFLWIWFLAPAFANVGKGIGQVISASRAPRALPPPAAPPHEALGPAEPHALAELQSRETAEIDDHPFSVTEGTTRHLDTAGATKQ
jgi:hypothetical protein